MVFSCFQERGINDAITFYYQLIHSTTRVWKHYIGTLENVFEAIA